MTVLLLSVANSHRDRHRRIGGNGRVRTDTFTAAAVSIFGGGVS